MPPIREGPYDVFVILHGADGVVEVLVKGHDLAEACRLIRLGSLFLRVAILRLQCLRVAFMVRDLSSRGAAENGRNRPVALRLFRMRCRANARGAAVPANAEAVMRSVRSGSILRVTGQPARRVVRDRDGIFQAQLFADVRLVAAHGLDAQVQVCRDLVAVLSSPTSRSTSNSRSVSLLMGESLPCVFGRATCSRMAVAIFRSHAPVR